MTFNEKLNSFWKKTKRMLLILLVFSIMLLTYFSLGHYSDGYRGGSLIKISKKGVLFKTYEGQINVGTFLDNGVNKPMSPIWDFSVKNDSKLYDALNNAILTNKRVKLHYKEMFTRLPWRGESLYIVDEVELLN
jgi:hypothetical protein